MEIARGAEAVITKEKDGVVKERVKKGYRLGEIDETLRKRRTATEAKLLREARRAGVATPQITGEEKFAIKMEYVNGKKVKDAINKENISDLAEKIGTAVAKLHNYNIIHGDLTTSNMLIKDEEIFFIDFGLGFISQRAEDKANDLYLLHEALESTHFEVSETAWASVLNGYREHYRDAEKVIKTLSEVEKRGRYKIRGNGQGDLPGPLPEA